MWLGIIWIEWKLIDRNLESQAYWNTAYVGNIFAAVDLVPVINENRKPKFSFLFSLFVFHLGYSDYSLCVTMLAVLYSSDALDKYWRKSRTSHSYLIVIFIRIVCPVWSTNYILVWQWTNIWEAPLWKLNCHSVFPYRAVLKSLNTKVERFLKYTQSNKFSRLFWSGHWSI